MSDAEFIRYLGPPGIHDGVIAGIHVNGDMVRVTIQAEDGDTIVAEFGGVESVRAHRAEGMQLYALAEWTGTSPVRRFVFANWDDGDDAYLEIVARDFKLVEGRSQLLSNMG